MMMDRYNTERGNRINSLPNLGDPDNNNSINENSSNKSSIYNIFCSNCGVIVSQKEENSYSGIMFNICNHVICLDCLENSRKCILDECKNIEDNGIFSGENIEKEKYTKKIHFIQYLIRSLNEYDKPHCSICKEHDDGEIADFYFCYQCFQKTKSFDKSVFCIECADKDEGHNDEKINFDRCRTEFLEDLQKTHTQFKTQKKVISRNGDDLRYQIKKSNDNIGKNIIKLENHYIASKTKFIDKQNIKIQELERERDEKINKNKELYEKLANLQKFLNNSTEQIDKLKSNTYANKNYTRDHTKMVFGSAETYLKNNSEFINFEINRICKPSEVLQIQLPEFSKRYKRTLDESVTIEKKQDIYKLSKI